MRRFYHKTCNEVDEVLKVGQQHKRLSDAYEYSILLFKYARYFFEKHPNT